MWLSWNNLHKYQKFLMSVQILVPLGISYKGALFCLNVKKSWRKKNSTWKKKTPSTYHRLCECLFISTKISPIFIIIPYYIILSNSLPTLLEMIRHKKMVSWRFCTIFPILSYAISKKYIAVAPLSQHRTLIDF